MEKGSKNVLKRKLLVISDSMVYRESDGSYSAFEPVVREMEGLCSIFDEIIWLGSISNIRTHALAMPQNDKIKIVPIASTFKYTGLANKLYVLLHYPTFIYFILKYLSKAKYVHSRAPSHPALITIIYSLFDRSRKYWHKFAGNWVQTDPPMQYRIQRSLLKKAHYNNIKVTVNGAWGDKDHVYAFENPCMFESERVAAAKNAAAKNYNGHLTMIFVGSIAYPHKGILKILESIEKGLMPDRIKTFYIVGNGILKEEIERRISNITSMQIVLLGHMNRAMLDEYYQKSHLIILPTIASEGFPKVIAEGAAHGCIPVVTGISALPQYIKDEQNGFIVKSQSPEDISEALHRLTNSSRLYDIASNAVDMAKKFTYEYYTNRIKNDIFNMSDARIEK